MAMSVQLAFKCDALEQYDQVIPKIGSSSSAPQRPGPCAPSWCFITTACVVSRGLADDCEELTVLRELRDGYLQRLKGGPDLMSHYYRVAPVIVSVIDQREDEAEVYDRIYGVVQRCVDMALSHEPHRAVERYRGMVRGLGVMTGVSGRSSTEQRKVSHHMARRPISIKVVNNTGLYLSLKEKNAIHGKFTTDPQDIDDGTSMTFKASELSASQTGPQGVVWWNDPQGGAFTITFNHPMGTGTTTVDASEPLPFGSVKSDDNLQQHEASCTITWFVQ